MNRYRMDTWRTARMNQMVHADLASRYRMLEQWSSLLVAVLGSGSVLAVVKTQGDTWATICALVLAILIAVRPLFGWGVASNRSRSAWTAWRTVEEMCEDDAPEVDIKRAERIAHQLDPVGQPWDLGRLIAKAFARTNAELPLSRFV